VQQIERRTAPRCQRDVAALADRSAGAISAAKGNSTTASRALKFCFASQSRVCSAASRHRSATRTPGANETCPPPPAETCCTRILDDPDAYSLRFDFEDNATGAISSVSVWHAGGCGGAGGGDVNAAAA
jgi:hypothetical protein